MVRDVTSLTISTPPLLADAQAALAAADEFADRIRPGSIERDRLKTKPLAELADLASTGLLSIWIPREYGGSGLDFVTVIDVFRRIAVADPAVAQLVLAHFVLLECARTDADEPTRRFIYDTVLAGAHLGNASAERGTKNGWNRNTRAQRDDARGGWVVTGQKYYATGALGAGLISVDAKYGDRGGLLGFVTPDSDGLTLDLDQWSSFGQRTTFSGAVTFDAVFIPDGRAIDYGEAPENPKSPAASVITPLDQALHVAIDVGIARAALEDGADFVRSKTRPWVEWNDAPASEEPHIQRRFGELTTRLHALEALLERAAGAVQTAVEETPLTHETATAASFAVAEAKALAQEFGPEIATGVLELAGTSSTDEKYGLDRHWRNVRVHSLHDPARWKYVHIGNHTLNGTLPPAGVLI